MDKTRKPEYKKDNLKFLRTHLRVTQTEFIQHFLTDENGKAMSVASLSGLESRGGKKINDVILEISESLGMEPIAFSLPPKQFAQRIHMLLPDSKDFSEIKKRGARKGDISQLLYRMTMYFAEQIFDEKLKKGDKVESDRVLAVKLNVGRSAVREALKVLDIMGILDIRPGQGTYIRNDERNFFVVPLSWSLFLNGGQTDNIITIRNLLEVKAAQLAAVCASQESIMKLHEISHQIHQAYREKNYKDFLDVDLQFHGWIAKASGNEVIYSMTQTIRSFMKRISGSGMVDEGQLKEIYEEHQKITGFILTGDGEKAAMAMEEHLVKSSKRYNYR